MLRTRRRGWLCLTTGVLLTCGAALAASGYFEQSHRLNRLPVWARVELMRWHRLLGPESMSVLDRSIERTPPANLSRGQFEALIAWWSEAPASFENSSTAWASNVVSDTDEGRRLVWVTIRGDTAVAAARRIARRSPRVVARIIGLLRSAPYSLEAKQAIAILQCMSEVSAEARGAIAQSLLSEGDPIRSEMCTAVLAAGPDSLVPALSGSLHGEVREDVWDAFRTCRHQAYLRGTADVLDSPQVRRTLLRALADPQAWTFALRTVQDHPPPPDEVAAGTEWLLLAGEGADPAGAFTELDRRIVDIIAAAGPNALEGVARACSDPRSHVRFRAVSVFQELGPRREAESGLPLSRYLPALVGSTADVVGSVRWAALAAARTIMARADSHAELADASLARAIAQAAVVAINRMAAEPRRGSPLDVAGLVSRLGAEAEPVRARLRELAASDDPRMRGLARQAIQRLDAAMSGE